MSVLVFSDDDTRVSGTWSLSDEGTIDWWWWGSGSNAAPLQVTMTANHRKRTGPGWLWRGFRWRSGFASTINQSTARTLTAAASENIVNSNVSSAGKTGYFQVSGTSMINVGFTMAVPAFRDRTLRLGLYWLDWRCNTTMIARIINGSSVEASDTILSFSNSGNTYHYTTIDFRSDTDGAYLYSEFICTSLGVGGVDQNLQFQGATLSEAP